MSCLNWPSLSFFLILSYNYYILILYFLFSDSNLSKLNNIWFFSTLFSWRLFLYYCYLFSIYLHNFFTWPISEFSWEMLLISYWYFLFSYESDCSVDLFICSSYFMWVFWSFIWLFSLYIYYFCSTLYFWDFTSYYLNVYFYGSSIGRFTDIPIEDTSALVWVLRAYFGIVFFYNSKWREAFNVCLSSSNILSYFSIVNNFWLDFYV